MIFKEVHKGVDSLYLSFRGKLRDEVLIELKSKQELARSDDEVLQAQGTMNLGNHCFEVKDKGRGKYKFVLVDNWFYVQIAGSNETKIPPVHVQISSELLNCAGLEESLRLLRAVVSRLLVSIEDEAISRLDIFIDFVTDKDFNKIDKDLWITQAVSQSEYSENRFLTGFSFGRGGAITGRLYNKVTEIKKSNKDFFKDIWRKQGWNESQEVWRMEFQLRKAFLTTMSTNSISEFSLTVNDIWKYCTEDWLRLAVDDGTENRSRWPTDELWKGIQDVRFRDGSFSGIERNVEKTRIPDDKALFLLLIGILISYAVRYQCNDIWKIVDRLISDAKRFLDEYTERSTKYKDSEEYIKKKMGLKKVRFNISGEV